jgi:hypothetical protein
MGTALFLLFIPAFFLLAVNGDVRLPLVRRPAVLKPATT